MISWVVLNQNDNVATALNDLPSGTTATIVDNLSIKLIEDVPYGFKFSIIGINKGDKIIKYGEAIGKASQDIIPGSVVHIHNVEGLRGRGDL